jgi:hypothetical protein
MIKETNAITWLLSGDPSIVYQTNRDLLNTDKDKLIKLQMNITKSGWARKFLDLRDNKTSMWGRGIYSPKWISTTYTMLDLKNIGIHPETKEYIESAKLLIDRLWKIPVKKNEKFLDLCVCGMLLSLCCYSKINLPKINEISDFILEKQFADGGWNCRWTVDKDHSSLHTTINILEGLYEYLENGYTYKKTNLITSIKKAHEFILMHKLYRSDKTGEVINDKMTKLSYPSRWKYDILRCMDYFRAAGQKYDIRMDNVLDIIIKKKMKNGHWPVQQKYSGLVHFDMEETGNESRWNTLRSLRVLNKYKMDRISK